MTISWITLGHGLYRNARKTLLLGLATLLPLLLLAPGIGRVVQGDGFYIQGENSQTQVRLKQHFAVATEPLMLLIYPAEPMDAESFATLVDDFLAPLGDDPRVASLTTPRENPDWRLDSEALVLIDPRGESVEEENRVALDILETLQARIPESLRMTATGGAILKAEIKANSQTDLIRAELIALPIAFVVLIYAFGGILPALIPLFSAGLSILATLGLLYLASNWMPLSIFVLNVASLVGLALAIDFALIFISRLRSEISAGHATEAALVTTVSTAGRAIGFSALSVFIGLSGLFWFDLNTFHSIAISGMLVVGLSAFIALTILPALLALTAGRLFRHARNNTAPSRAVRLLIRQGIERPRITLLLGSAILAVMILPVRDMQLELPSSDALPAEHAARQALIRFQLLTEGDTEERARLEMLLPLPAPLSDVDGVRYLQEYVSGLSEQPGVLQVDSLLSFLPITDPGMITMALRDPRLAAVRDRFVDQQLARLTVKLDSGPNQEATTNWLAAFLAQRDQLPEPQRPRLTGEAFFNYELRQEITAKLLHCVIWVVAATSLVLLVLFRSLLIPFKAIGINLLGLLATLGTVSWLVAQGWFGLSQGAIFLLLPVLVFALVFGLSMDYEVFLMTRIQEAYLESGDNNLATRVGLEQSARVVTNAALIMIVVSLAFAFTQVRPVQQLGVGIAFNILLEATLLRLLLVPSLMRLMGDWNWWLPGRGQLRQSLRRLKPQN